MTARFSYEAVRDMKIMRARGPIEKFPIVSGETGELHIDCKDAASWQRAFRYFMTVWHNVHQQCLRAKAITVIITVKVSAQCIRAVPKEKVKPWKDTTG